MLHVQLSNIGKKFYQNWLFKGIDQTLSPGDKLALIGSNGTGKSTLMRIIAGQLAPTEGKITYSTGNAPGKMAIPVEKVYRFISWSGPYIELYGDLTLAEHIRLHFRFKKSTLSDPKEIIEILDLKPHKDKKLGVYSSGMLQRVKVGLALFTQSEALLLDEPTSNMDAGNATRMLRLIDEHLGNRVYVLASNMEREFERIGEVVRL